MFLGVATHKGFYYGKVKFQNEENRYLKFLVQGPVYEFKPDSYISINGISLQLAKITTKQSTPGLADTYIYINKNGLQRKVLAV